MKKYLPIILFLCCAVCMSLGLGYAWQGRPGMFAAYFVACVVFAVLATPASTKRPKGNYPKVKRHA